jgi:hypothetical protein
MTELNGIDILCDAAGSDLLLDTPLPASNPEQHQQHDKSAKRVKLSDGSSPGGPVHACHICKRVYERYVRMFCPGAHAGRGRNDLARAISNLYV